MFMDVGGGWFSSLRVRLLAALAVIQIVFVLATFVGLNSFLGRFFERTAESQAAQLGQTIRLGLRQQMLRASDTGLDRSLADLRQIQDLRRIWIVDKHGRVAQATDRPTIGHVLDRQRNPVCTVCHTGSAIPATSTAFVTDDNAERTPLFGSLSRVSSHPRSSRIRPGGVPRSADCFSRISCSTVSKSSSDRRAIAATRGCPDSC